MKSVQLKLLSNVLHYSHKITPILSTAFVVDYCIQKCISWISTPTKGAYPN